MTKNGHTFRHIAAPDLGDAVLNLREQGYTPVWDDVSIVNYLNARAIDEGARPDAMIVNPYDPERLAVVQRGTEFVEIFRDPAAPPTPMPTDPPMRSSRSRTLTVAGTKVHVRRWGPESAAHRILLVHGTRANTHWWDRTVDHIDPAIQVDAIDLTGNGQSGWRDGYSSAIWVEEIRKAIADDGPVTLVGHSMGGRLTLLVAAQYPDLVERVVVVDTIFHPVKRPPDAQKPSRVYASEEEALGRFRMLPEQPWPSGETLRRLGRASLHQAEGGWAWRFDHRAIRIIDDVGYAHAIEGVSSPVHVIRASESSITSAGDAPFLRSITGQPTTDTVIHGGFHHLPLDSAAQLGAILERIVLTGAPTSLDKTRPTTAAYAPSISARSGAFSHVAIVVSDLDRAQRFYTGLLGAACGRSYHGHGPDAERIMEVEGADFTGVFIAIGEVRIELLNYTTTADTSIRRRPDSPGYAHLSFVVDDLTLVFSRASELGGSSGPDVAIRFGSLDSTRIAFVQDPDGNRIELIEHTTAEAVSGHARFLGLDAIGWPAGEGRAHE